MGEFLDVLIGAGLGGALVLFGNWILDSFRRQGADLPRACRLIEEIHRMIRSVEDKTAGIGPGQTSLAVRQIQDLHDWHAKEDPNGVKIWYVRRDMVDALRSLIQEIREIRDEIESVKRRLGPPYSGDAE